MHSAQITNQNKHYTYTQTATHMAFEHQHAEPPNATRQAGNQQVTTEQQARQIAARMAVRWRNSHSTQQECRSLVLRRQQACVNRDLPFISSLAGTISPQSQRSFAQPTFSGSEVELRARKQAFKAAVRWRASRDLVAAPNARWNVR